MIILRKTTLLGCAAAFLFSCAAPDQPKRNNKELAHPFADFEDVTKIDLNAIKSSFDFDPDQFSYAYGQALRAKLLQQGYVNLIEGPFINAFLRAKKEETLRLDQVNSRLMQLRQMRVSNPSESRELSEYVGLYTGLTEKNEGLMNQVQIASFAQGFKDKSSGINELNKVLGGDVNCDSLLESTQNQYAEYVGKRYLEENISLNGVQSTASGLQYRRVKKGTGPSPNDKSQVTVHYRGTLVSGEVFDSSYDRGEPISFGLDKVIPGWTEGLQLMKVGAAFKFYIPYELAYGSRSTGSIPAYSTLIFEVELLDFKNP